MSSSARLALPLLLPGQAQKEVTHNEALARLDLVVHASAQTIGLNTPPETPETGQCWIIGGLPTAGWTGRAGQLAGWTDGGWRFMQPFAGLDVWLIDEGVVARWDGDAWQVGIVSATAIHIGDQQILGARQPAIADPSGGSNSDVEAREAIGSILDAMRTHGLIGSEV